MKFCPICSKEFGLGAICPEDGATLILKATLDDALIGQVLKEAYRIEEQIGVGGMGAVYRVTQIRLGRSVAVKVLLPQFQSTPEMVRRFFREARMLSQLNHPNIITIIDFGNTEEGLIYMVMEYLEGQTLEEFVARGQGLSKSTLLYFMNQIAQGLAAAHEIPLLHRDLKPSNIFISQFTGKGTVLKILDFGISKLLDDHEESLTQTGIVMGSPGYIAPEQIDHSIEPSITADIYALGGILYFMMGGRSPFSGHSLHTALTKQLTTDPDPIPSYELSDSEVRFLFPVVLKAMARNPSERYQSVNDLMVDLVALAGSDEVRLDKFILSGRRQKLDAPTFRVWQTSQIASADLLTKGRFAKPKKASAGIWRGKRILVTGLIAAFFSPLVWLLFQNVFPSKQLPLVFGMSADFSGSNRELGREMKLGLETCFKEVNLAGGVHKRELSLVALDDHYEPEPAVTNLRELLTDHRVFGIIGNVGTPTAAAILPIANEEKILFFAPFSGAGFLRKDPPDRYVFNYRASYEEECAAIVRYYVTVRKFDPRSIAVFSQDDSFGDAGFEGVQRTLRGYGVDATNILHVRYHRNSLDINAAVAGILAEPERARAVVTASTYKQTARFISAVRTTLPETSFSCLSFVGATALAEEFIENGPASARDVIITQVVPYFNSNATGVIRYREALAVHFPNELPGFVSLEGYIAARLMVEGLKRSSRLDTEAVIDSLEQIADLDLGTGSVMSFSPSRHQASHKVWAVILDDKAQFSEISLD